MGREDARGKGKVYKLAFIDPMCDVTFLCPNKKVTKEVVLRDKTELPHDTRRN